MAECGRPVTALPLTVRRFDDGVPGTRTVTLARVDGAMLPSFTPGSHIVIECGPAPSPARSSPHSRAGAFRTRWTGRQNLPRNEDALSAWLHANETYTRYIFSLTNLYSVLKGAMGERRASDRWLLDVYGLRRELDHSSVRCGLSQTQGRTPDELSGRGQDEVRPGIRRSRRRPRGRATFEFVTISGELRCRWRRVGDCDVVKSPPQQVQALAPVRRQIEERAQALARRAVRGRSGQIHVRPWAVSMSADRRVSETPAVLSWAYAERRAVD